VQPALHHVRAGGVQQRLALVAIGRHPWEYARDSGRLFRTWTTSIQSFEGRDGLRDELRFTDPPLGAGLTPALWRLGRVLATAWWLVSLHMLAALLLLVAAPAPARRAEVAA
jgi:hypothetical protein